MKNWHLCALLAVAVPTMAAAAGDEIEVVSAGATSTITVGDSFASTNFNGWNITATGSSFSPGLSPIGIGLQVNATCLSGNCLANPLNVFFTSAGFSALPSFGFATSYTATETTGETTRAVTWAASDSGVPPTPFLGGLPGVGTTHIGTVTLSSSGSNSVTGSPSAGLTSPYDLTMEESFTDSTGTVAAFTASGNVTAAAPEIDPASAMGGLTLLAGGLAVLRGRRRKS